METVVVNAFWQPDRLAAHLERRAAAGLPPRTILRREEVLLETGGGVRAALDLLGEAPFYVVNGDAFWVDGPRPALVRLAEAFGDDVDGVLLVHRTFQVHAEVGFGDFALDKWGAPAPPRRAGGGAVHLCRRAADPPGAADRHAGGSRSA